MAVVLPLALVECRNTEGEAVSVSDFGLEADTGKDASAAVRRALEYCEENGASKLTFDAGRYDFYPDHAFEKYMYVSNHNDGMKRVAFLMEDMNDFEIYAPGAEFVFHGYTSPFVIINCKNVTLKGFSIDFARSFQSEGRILSAGDGILEVSFPEEYPFRVENERLKFYDESGTVEYPFGNLLEFDPVKMETAYMARDYYIGNNIKAEQTGPREVRVRVPEITGTKGNIMVFAPNHRHVPNVVAERCENLLAEGLTMYNSGGMGIIAQLCRNVTVRNMTVTPPEGKVVSCTADATHFSNCTGTILIEDCLFENQMDDATNVHGIYMRIEDIPQPDKLLVRLVHHEQRGMNIFRPGETLELVDANTVVTYAHAKLAAVKRLNEELTELTFTENLPQEVKLKDVVGATEFPDVILRNSVCRRNRARGVLLGSRRSILVEGCTFHIGGSAIMTGGDSQYWFEQGGVTNLTVRNNLFDNCNYGNWGKAAVSIDAGRTPEPESAARFNRNVRFEGNEFRTFDPRIMEAVSVDGLVFENNRIIHSGDYPPTNAGAEPFVIKRSINVSIDNNQMEE